MAVAKTWWRMLLSEKTLLWRIGLTGRVGAWHEIFFFLFLIPICYMHSIKVSCLGRVAEGGCCTYEGLSSGEEEEEERGRG